MGTDSVFVSYSHKYSDWTKGLVDNLNRCGVEVFLDERDIGAGLSWVSRIEEGLCRAARFVLVATPEALASPRVKDELDALVTRHRDWVQAGRLLVAMLVQTPLPPFRATIQHIDFCEHDRAKYLEAFGKLVAGARGLSSSVRLPEGVVAPDAPKTELADALRSKIVTWAAPAFGTKVFRGAMAGAMGEPAHVLNGFGSPECTASAAMVMITGSDHPVQAAVRFVETVADAVCEDLPAMKAGAEALLDDLTAVLPPDESGLLADYRKQVVSDHGNLVPYFRRSGAAAVLDRVYVRLDLRRTEQRAVLEHQDKDWVPSKPLCIKGLLSLSASWVTGHWVVKGDPGSGKTTLLRHLAWELCSEGDSDHNPRGWVPLYAPIPALGLRALATAAGQEDRRC